MKSKAPKKVSSKGAQLVAERFAKSKKPKAKSAPFTSKPLDAEDLIDKGADEERE